jgi:hypothetical protein
VGCKMRLVAEFSFAWFCNVYTHIWQKTLKTVV